ncbi:MAG: helix-turn-helix domain-containing protein [Candidatus Rokubacteria bacterium]|nr:helix-turn-helix domain-containing protein [Candidatus Rokubacteria bacterium]
MDDNTNDTQGVVLPVVAERLKVARRTVYDARWRRRVGLPVCRIGRRLIVIESDLRRFLRHAREQRAR